MNLSLFSNLLPALTDVTWDASLWKWVMIGIVLLIPIECLSSVVRLIKPEKPLRVFCHLDTFSRAPDNLQYLDLLYIERLHGMSSFLKHLFTNRRVSVFILIFSVRQINIPIFHELVDPLVCFDRRHGIVVLLPHLLLGFLTEASPQFL